MYKYFMLVLVLLFPFSKGMAQLTDYDSIYLIRNCVILDAKESVQDERDDLIYTWTFGDGTVGSGEIVEHCYDSLGTYEVMLSIIDPTESVQFQDEWFYEVEIGEDYSISFGINSQQNKTLSMTSQLFYLDKPKAIQFFWDFGDGKYGIGEKIKHTYKNAGEYAIRLLARVDGEEEIVSLSKSKTIQIN